jgi:DNA-binding XRE family transcriptional regulator
MSVAKKIQKELDVKTDLKVIKKVISLYEKLKKEDDELLTMDDAMEHLDSLLGDIGPADSIKAFRDRESLTQKELALKAGIKQQHLSEIERGLRPIGVAMAKKLSKALNCHYKSLL